MAIVIGDIQWSVGFLLLGFVFDSLDGLVARKLNVQSDFGKQLDSLADVVSFGVAPAYLYSLYSPDPNNKWFTIIACIMIVIAGTIRLATFNISPSKTYFMGLPIPANALFYIGLFIAISQGDLFIYSLLSSKLVYFLIPFVMSVMMVSFKIQMFSTKGMTKNHQDNMYQYILGLICILMIIVFKTSALPYMIVSYILLSILATAINPNKE
jgi:CDP-diacylglycerol---serine O-phosphatidyltransferase